MCLGRDQASPQRLKDFNEDRYHIHSHVSESRGVQISLGHTSSCSCWKLKVQLKIVTDLEVAYWPISGSGLALSGVVHFQIDSIVLHPDNSIVSAVPESSPQWWWDLMTDCVIFPISAGGEPFVTFLRQIDKESIYRFFHAANWRKINCWRN